MSHSTQQAFLIRISGDNVHGLGALNEQLANGGHVVHTTALGGGHATDVAALVVVETPDNETAALPVRAEHESMPTESDDPVGPPDTPMEGDGAPPEADPDIDPTINP